MNDFFTDVEDGAFGLTFTIASNSNAALVTPIIGADSALDLSFGADQSGTAQIVIRATDSGSLFVDEALV